MRAFALSLSVALILLMSPSDAQAQLVLAPSGAGTNNSITDVEGILVGHFTDAASATGTTVITAPNTAVGGFDVRGGWPITVETDLLDPRNLVHFVNAIVLTGGGSAGLDSRVGVMRCLEDRQEGFSVGVTTAEVVPIVPGAAIQDLDRPNPGTRPNEDFGYRACQAAADGATPQGNVGAGAGAIAGGLKGGFGTASVNLRGGIVMGAAVVVNATGRVYRTDTCELYSTFLQIGTEFAPYRPSPTQACSPAKIALRPGNTIGVVATNFALSKAQAQKMAGTAQDGIARALRPSHTSFDGDVVFALSTGAVESVDQCQAYAPHLAPTLCAFVLNDLYAAATDTMSRAVYHAILKSQSTASAKSYCDTFPVSCGRPAAASIGPNPPAAAGFSYHRSSTSSVPGVDEPAALGVAALVAIAGVVNARRPRRSRPMRDPQPKHPKRRRGGL